MGALPKELTQEIILENDFKNPGEIMFFQFKIGHLAKT